MADKLRQIQHGDVLLQEVAGMPSGAVRTPNEGRVVVARGEQTGHSHIIKSDRVSLWTLTENDVTELYLEVQTPVTIIHDEHKPLPIPPGIYRVGRVKEYDYFGQMKAKAKPRPMERYVID